MAGPIAKHFETKTTTARGKIVKKYQVVNQGFNDNSINAGSHDRNASFSSIRSDIGTHSCSDLKDIVIIEGTSQLGDFFEIINDKSIYA